MRKTALRIGVISIVSLLIVATAPFPLSAATPPVTIVLSKIGDSSSTDHPGLMNTSTVTGYLIDGRVYIKTSDIAAHFPCTITYYASYIVLVINGQTTRAYVNSPYYYTYNAYSVYATPTTTKNYEFFGSANIPYGIYAARLFNSAWYVAIDILKPLGVLKIYTESLDEYEVYDFRANGGGVTDSNDYVVGGPWIQSGYCYQTDLTKPANAAWSGMSGHHLAPNFVISELWDHSTSAQNPDCYTQLKSAVALLSSAQQVRYVNNGGNPLNFDCSFRSWWYNKYVGGWYASFHMRGRAFDAPYDPLYGSVYDDFCGTHATPIAVGVSYWRRQPEVTWSIGDEIETMPRDGNYWLHMQVDPSAQSGAAPYYP